MDRKKIRNMGTAVGVFYAVTYLMIRFFDVNVTQSFWVYLLVCAGIFHILKFRPQDSDNMLTGNRILHILSFLLSLTIITGIYFDNDLPFENMTSGIFINYLICVVCFTPLCNRLFAIIFRYMGRLTETEQNTGKERYNKLIIGGGHL